MSKKILIIAGEASGDLYGAHLVSALKERCPEAEFFGVGGGRMKSAGVKIMHSINELAIMGVSEIIPKLMFIKKLYWLLCAKVNEERIDLAILVNYPGFNLRFARVLKKKDIPIVFYSSPQVWAWGSWRINSIKKFVDKMVVFLKFEEEFYKRRGVGAEFVGHPLVDIVRPKGEDLGIKKGVKVISLVPGSRENEVRSLFPIILKAAEKIYSKNKDVQFLITKHPELPSEIYLKSMEGYKLPLMLIDGKTYDCLKESFLAIAASGSVTLEATILKVPMIILYRVSFLTGILFLIFARIPHLGLVNLIAGKRIMPEFLQYHCTPKNIANEVAQILSNNERFNKMRGELQIVNDLIGPPGASSRAATSIAKLLD